MRAGSNAPHGMLSLTDVTVRRGTSLVVEGLHLEVRPGSIFWVIGPNGAGKSSLLRVMAGLDRPAAGSVRRSAPPGSPFLYLHPEMGHPPAATVGDWERLVLRLMPAGSAVSRTRLWPAVEPGRRVGRLSTGERKRLLLDALLRRPGSLLLDEPFEHLSPVARSDLGAILDARARATVVVVATNQEMERAERGRGIQLRFGTATPLGSGAGGWDP
jgi:ABC-type multidrug transport system ATPase subunit